MKLKIDLNLEKPKEDEKGYVSTVADFSTTVEGTESDFRELLGVVVGWLNNKYGEKVAK